MKFLGEARLEYICCNICGSSEYKIIHEARKKDIANTKFSLGVLHPNYGRIVRCKKCGLVYANPRPDIKELIQSYSQLEDLGYSSQMNSRIKTFQQVEKLIERYAIKGRLLDVGCASGYFLYVAQKSGWQIEGVEVSQNLAKQAEHLLKIKIKLGTLEDAKFPANYFDIISMFDVFEHLPQPVETLQEINRIMKPNGILVINFPAIDSIFAKLMGRHWWFLLEDHLYYFDREVLTKMLNKGEFKVLFFKAHWQYLTFTYLAKLLHSFCPKLSRISSAIVKTLHIENVSLRYYAGQTTLFAKKIKIKD